MSSTNLLSSVVSNAGNGTLSSSGPGTSDSRAPVAEDGKGQTVTDPAGVLKVWRDFSASIAPSDLNDTEEEGIYDEEYKAHVESRLELLRRVRLLHPILDKPITVEEVWKAVRKLKLGKAAGQDEVSTDILKTAADAVGTSRMRGHNTVITSLCLLFNFVLDREVWPERWGTGVIFPLHKGDSRLDPSIFRAFTLLLL